MCHSLPGVMCRLGSRQSTAWQSTSPRATRGAHALRCASWSAPYPRACLVPGFGMGYLHPYLTMRDPGSRLIPGVSIPTPGDDEGPAVKRGPVEML
jgi:hypothetical protein